MRNLKKTRFFSLGRKWVFTLALFLFVFAAASVVKIHASSTDNVTGWLWGGGAESDGSTPYDGTNTNVGWISMNNTNSGAGGSTSYGVNIPGDGTAASGYGWSENIGWVSFNSGDLAGCPSGTCNARREGDNLKGWARIISIPQAGANAGGWQGWVSLSGSNYGVQMSKMLGIGSGSHTYAWSDELGWIDFGQAQVVTVPYLSITPSLLNLQNGNNPGTLYAKVTKDSASGDPINGKVVTFTKTGSSKVSIDGSGTCTTSGLGECTISVRASDFATDEDATITGTCAGCTSRSVNVHIIHTPVCTISCPSSVEVPIGDNVSYDVTVGGESGCALASCSASGSSSISSTKDSATKCKVTVDASGKLGDNAVSTAYTNGTGSCATNVLIKRQGWIETNP